MLRLKCSKRHRTSLPRRSGSKESLRVSHGLGFEYTSRSSRRIKIQIYGIRGRDEHKVCTHSTAGPLELDSRNDFTP